MTDDAVVEALRAFYRRQIERTPERHSKWSPACLPLPRFHPERQKEWTAEERAHVEGCRDYCQRMLALGWREEHPPIAALVEHARGIYPYAEALRFHLEEDGCRRCQLVLRGFQAIGDIAASWRWLVVWLSEGSVTLAPAATFAAERPPLLVRQASEDGSWVVTVRETDPPEHEFVVHVEVLKYEACPDKVQVTLIGEQESITQEVTLSENHGRCEGRCSFGPFAEVTARLGESWVVLARLS
jgi:hypothetical protein